MDEEKQAYVEALKKIREIASPDLFYSDNVIGTALCIEAVHSVYRLRRQYKWLKGKEENGEKQKR